MQQLSAVILAAGKGTRMPGDLPKVAHEVAGAPMVHWVVDACRQAGCAKLVIVVGYKQEVVRAIFAEDKGLDVARIDSGSGPVPLTAESARTAISAATTEPSVISDAEVVILTIGTPVDEFLDEEHISRAQPRVVADRCYVTDFSDDALFWILARGKHAQRRADEEAQVILVWSQAIEPRRALHRSV